jgi:hypothetical protein
VGVQNFQVLLIDDSINANNKQTKNKKQNKKKPKQNKTKKYCNTFVVFAKQTFH